MVVLETYVDGFTIKVASSVDIIVLNGVPITSPDMYYSDWIVVHGLYPLLSSSVMQQATGIILLDLMEILVVVHLILVTFEDHEKYSVFLNAACQCIYSFSLPSRSMVRFPTASR